MLNLFGVKKVDKLIPYILPNARKDALVWQMEQADMPFKLIEFDDPAIKKIKPAAKLPDRYYNEFDKYDIIYVPFTEKDFYDRILSSIWDADWDKEDDRRAKESWVQNFGPNIPFGQEPESYDEDEVDWENVADDYFRQKGLIMEPVDYDF